MKLYKYIFVLSLIFAFSANVRSQDANGSYLNISLYDGGSFSYIIDKNEVSNFNDEASFDNLSSGSHYLKVFRETNLMKKTPDVIFSDYINIPAGYNLFAVIDEYEKFYIYKKVSDINYHKKHDCNCDCEYCRNCVYKNNSHRKDETYNKNDDDCRHNVIKKKNFDDLKSSIESKSFESTKLEMIKQVSDENYFTSEQLKSLLQTLSFESSKLDAAKYVYSKICDNENFYKVYDVFSFESSIDELKDFISGKK